jgi:hypothetical protein
VGHKDLEGEKKKEKRKANHFRAISSSLLNHSLKCLPYLQYHLER